MWVDQVPELNPVGSELVVRNGHLPFERSSRTFLGMRTVRVRERHRGNGQQMYSHEI